MNLQRAVVVTMGKDRRISAEVVEADSLVATMQARGYELMGPVQNSRLRPELQGAPEFAGILGPMWGGPETPLRYEDTASYEVISR